MMQKVPAYTGGEFTVIAHPVKYSNAETTIRRGAPMIGEHGAEVLAEFGFSEAEIAALIDSGAVGKAA